MITEYFKKTRSFVKWLVPFALAVILLFGCGSAAQTPAEAPGETVETVQETSEQSEKQSEKQTEKQTEEQTEAQHALEEDGSYTAKDEVALYIHTYGELPENFISKKQAEKLGWVSRDANLWEVAPGKSIGGSHFGNYEGQLPEKDGRKWYECDIDFDGGYRGAKRIIYSNDGLIYYTEDHYETFEQLY